MFPLLTRTLFLESIGLGTCPVPSNLQPDVVLLGYNLFNRLIYRFDPIRSAVRFCFYFEHLLDSPKTRMTSEDKEFL
jgi:hypothetical protein